MTWRRRLLMAIVILVAGVGLYYVLNLDFTRDPKDAETAKVPKPAPEDRSSSGDFRNDPLVAVRLVWPESARGSADPHGGSWPSACVAPWRQVLSLTLQDLSAGKTHFESPAICREWERLHFVPPAARDIRQSDAEWIYYRAAIVEVLAGAGHVRTEPAFLAHRLIARMQMGLVTAEELDEDLHLLDELATAVPDRFEIPLARLSVWVMQNSLHGKIRTKEEFRDLLEASRERGAPAARVRELEEWINRDAPGATKKGTHFNIPLQFGSY